MDLIEHEYCIIAYLIGKERYKKILIEVFNDKFDTINKYREVLKENYLNSDFVMVMINKKFDILTAWVLETPSKLIDVAEYALKQFETGEELYIDNNLSLIKLFGTEICDDIINESQEMKIINEKTANELKNLHKMINK